MSKPNYLLDFGSEYIFITESYYEFIEKAVINNTDWIYLRDVKDQQYFINVKQIKFIRKIENIEEYL